MANMFCNSDKISKTVRRTIPVAFIYQTPPAVVVTAVSIRRFPAGMQIRPVVSFGKGEEK